MNWNPFRHLPVNLVIHNQVATLADELSEMQAQLDRVTDERDELRETRSIRLHKQMETKGLETTEDRMSSLLIAERKLQAVARLMSGEGVDVDVALLRQLGNRIGLSSPTVDRIYARIDALQSLAPRLTQIKEAVAGIDWDEDVSFEFDEDAEAMKEVMRLVR